MVRGRSVPVLLFLVVLTVRPHMAGGAYPFAQGLVLIPGLVGLALLFLTPAYSISLPKKFLPLMALPWILALWALISMAWAPDPGQGSREIVGLLCNLTVFTFVFFWIQESVDLEKISVPVLSLVVLPVLASAFYQRIFGFGKIRETLQRMDQSGEPVANLVGIISQNRVFAGFLNSNMLAGFLAITIPFTLDLALGARHRRRLLYFYILLAAQGTVLIMTGSLGGTLAAAAMTGAVFLVRRSVKPRDMILACAILAFFAAGLFTIRGIGFLFGPDSSLFQRAGYMAAGIRMASVHPLLGWGAGASPGALMGFVAEGVRPVADPHNFLLRAWISWGLPGLAVLVVFLSLWFKSVMGLFRARGLRMGPQGYAGLVFGSAAFLGHSLLDMDFFVPEAALFGWCALGAALGMAAAHSEGLGRGTPMTFSRGRMVLGGVVLVTVLPAFAFLQGESIAYRGHKAVEEREFEEAARLYSAARTILPFNGRIALDEGRARFADDDRPAARVLFREADTLMRASPYPSWEMARLYQAQGDWEKSVPLLERALSRFNTSPRIRIDLARAYLNMRDVEKVIRYLKEARRYAIFDTQAREMADEILVLIKQ